MINITDIQMIPRPMIKDLNLYTKEQLEIKENYYRLCLYGYSATEYLRAKNAEVGEKYSIFSQMAKILLLLWIIF
jgi:hypothetical protein